MSHLMYYLYAILCYVMMFEQYVLYPHEHLVSQRRRESVTRLVTLSKPWQTQYDKEFLKLLGNHFPSIISQLIGAYADAEERRFYHQQCLIKGDPVTVMASLGVYNLGVGYGSGSIGIYDVQQRLWRRRYVDAHSFLVSALVSYGEGCFFSGSYVGSMRKWMMHDNVLRSELTRHSTKVNVLKILEPGYLASASDDGHVMVWDVDQKDSGILVSSLFFDGRVKSLLVQRPGQFFALAESHAPVCLTYTIAPSFMVQDPHRGERSNEDWGTMDMAIHPLNIHKFLVSIASSQRCVKFWSCATGSKIKKIGQVAIGNNPYKVTFHSDRIVLAGCEDGRVAVVDAIERRCIQMIEPQAEGIISGIVPLSSDLFAVAYRESGSIHLFYKDYPGEESPENSTSCCLIS